MMRILLCGDINSIHLIRWTRALAERGHVVGLFSWNKADFAWYEGGKNIELLFEGNEKYSDAPAFKKLKYLFYLKKLKRILADWKPDLLHAHYATSYGLIGALSGFRPYLISVWGTDVYGAADHSILMRNLLKFVFSRADAVCSTSICMKQQTEKFTDKPIHVVPFGSNPEKFFSKRNAFSDKNKIVLASIKPVNETYGISHIIEAMPEILRKLPEVKVKLRLVGTLLETDRINYSGLVDKLSLKDYIHFTGRVKPEELPMEFNAADIVINATAVNESFGVTLVEAMMCERPLIITPAPGPLEITQNGTLAKVVPMKDPVALAAAVTEIYENREKYRDLAKKARAHALEHYIWDKNVDCLTEIYRLYARKD